MTEKAIVEEIEFIESKNTKISFDLNDREIQKSYKNLKRNLIFIYHILNLKISLKVLKTNIWIYKNIICKVKKYE